MSGRKPDWADLDGEAGWKLVTPWGVAIVKPTRGYPRSRKFRVIVNGRDVDRFVEDAITARKIAEEHLIELGQKKTSL